MLEVGCGKGELAIAMAEAGYEVTAIDPEAPAGEIFRAVNLEQFADPGPYDGVVASRSLHHIADLPAALDKIASLLRPAGLIIVNEHACDRFDRATARWYLARLPPGPDRPASEDDCLQAWDREHAGLHGHAAMRRELDRRFRERFFAWRPYLYGELDGPELKAEEAALIEAGQIQATGFRYVGERR